MSRVAYFDCFSGASGDMITGALIDAGLSFDALRGELGGLGLPDGAFTLSVAAVQRAGFAATKFDVEVTEQPHHRSLAEVFGIIEASGLPASDRQQIRAVFQALGEAEAKVHGEPLDAVELHEVGAVDAIVDVSAAVAGLRLLGIDQVYVSPLPLGHGQVKGRHGLLPVPAPATLELIARAGAPIAEGEGQAGELLTPTGAAILTTLGEFKRPAMRVQKTGSGAGGRDPDGRPNILRVWLGEADTPLRRMRVIETNIDDMTPELLAYAQERLFAAGAADVWFTPIQMKKNRPGVMLSVIGAEALESTLADILLRETSTLGVRVREVGRYEAQREVFEFASSLGPAAVKVKRLSGEQPALSPEFEVCRRLSEAHGLPLAEVYRLVTAEAEVHMKNEP
jgi:uncharacterized protein (TIGR00299 family) protein